MFSNSVAVVPHRLRRSVLRRQDGLSGCSAKLFDGALPCAETNNRNLPRPAPFAQNFRASTWIQGQPRFIAAGPASGPRQESFREQPSRLAEFLLTRINDQ